MKKLNVIKQNEIFFWNLNFFMKIIPPHALKYKRINFAASNNQLWQISLFQPNWNDFQNGLNLRLRVKSAKYIAH